MYEFFSVDTKGGGFTWRGVDIGAQVVAYLAVRPVEVCWWRHVL